MIPAVVETSKDSELQQNCSGHGCTAHSTIHYPVWITVLNLSGTCVEMSKRVFRYSIM